jgi:D-alanine-D-alanine ligase
MNSSDKIRVAVLYGGRSAEHEISLQSAANVIKHLDRSCFEVTPIGIDKQGNWFLGDDIFSKSLEHKNVPLLHDKNNAWFTPAWMSKLALQQQIKGLNINQVTNRLFDVIFPVVHGPLCEDGTLQGLLELADLPYVGAGVLASAVGMDKDISKRLALGAGIPVAPYMAIKYGQWERDSLLLTQQITNKLGYPVFVKPANTGSSIGIQKIKTPDQLASAVISAFKFDTKILVEKALNVAELELAVLESLEPGTDPIVSITGEVKTRHEFYSYAAKYMDDDGAELLIPAPYPESIKKQASEIAKNIFTNMECEGMARVDLFLDKDTKQLYFNEVNTIPGFTPISMYPKLMIASGISYKNLLAHLIQLAVKRHRNKSQLIRNYSG